MKEENTMEELKNLVGQFIKGSLKNGGKFFGEVVSDNGDWLVLTGRPDEEGKTANKYVRKSDITEFYSEPVKRGKENE